MAPPKRFCELCGRPRFGHGYCNAHYKRWRKYGDPGPVEILVNCHKHGDAPAGAKTKLYYVWSSMKGRCTNPNSRFYHRYGGRGIYVDDVWSEYSPFKEWAMATGYALGLEIDRIDNDGPYSPANCQWLTKRQNVQKRWGKLPEQ